MMGDEPTTHSMEDNGFAICEGRNDPGCPCDTGAVLACYSEEPDRDENGETYCLEGVRECRDGTWSECNFGDPVRHAIIGAPELCGGCDPACFRQHTSPDGHDLDDDNANNLRFDSDRNGLVLNGRAISARYAYIANSGENTVSKIDIGTRSEVGRYFVGDSPSRTAVDAQGNCYVAMRGEANETVAKIAGDTSSCLDRNHNGRIDTSSGSNVLGRGSDECVIWWSTAAAGACPRAVAIDRHNRVWIGGWCINQFYVLNPDNGSLIRTVPISASAYGAAIDSEGMLWYSGRSHGWIQNINTETFAVGPARETGCGGDLYGITVDLQDRVWIVCAHQDCRASRFDPVTGEWLNICSIHRPRTARGITVDAGGDIWIATHHDWDWNYGRGYAYRFDSNTGDQKEIYTIRDCDGAIGIASDFENNIWLACYGSWSADVLNPDSGAVSHIPVGAFPYTYSDFTGFLRATITAPEGYYKQLYDSRLACHAGDEVVWSQLYYRVETPENTRINIYARSAARTSDLSAAREILMASIPGDESPVDIQDNMANQGVPGGMRYLEVRVQLQSLNRETSPVFRSIDLVYYCEADQCGDGERNGRETNVDCGGPQCGPCGLDSECDSDNDCSSANCSSGTCLACEPRGCPVDNEFCIEGECGTVASCLELHRARPSLPSGMYTITPRGSSVRTIEVFCDMETDGGGYTFFKADYGREANAEQAEEHCAAWGMQLFIPRSPGHRNRALDIARNDSIGPSASDNYMRILGIYPRANGAVCTNVGFNSVSCSNWHASDDESYYVSSQTNITEPNGDNDTRASMYYTWADHEISWYNDAVYPGYTSQYFMCDIGDKFGCNDDCNYPESCLELRRDGETHSGMYTILPEGSAWPVEVYCDMVTDGGGYTFLKVDYGDWVNALQAENYCDEFGMQLFVPRTEAHRNAALDIARNESIGPGAHDFYMRILGIYPRWNGAGCVRIPLNSSRCGSWHANDDGPYFVTNRSDITEPNGDNDTKVSMQYSWIGYEANWYNDISWAGYTSSYFMCDIGDKTGP
jgi:streptogramin lyase